MKANHSVLWRALALLLAVLVQQSHQNCPFGFEQFGTHCYSFTLPTGNWLNARRYCMDASAEWVSDLSVFDSPEESKFVMDAIKSKPFASQWYIGVYYDTASLSMTYVNGTKLRRFGSPTLVPNMNWAPGVSASSVNRYATLNVTSMLWEMGPGTAPARYVCELTLIRKLQCEYGWYKGPDQMCHKLVKTAEGADWQASNAICQDNLDSSLVKILNAETNNFGQTLLPPSSSSSATSFWIGGKSKKDGASYSWVWSDSTALTYTDWRNESDSIIADSANYDSMCIEKNYDKANKNYQWTSTNCNQRKEWAWCHRPVARCQPGWRENDKSCYLEIAERMTFANANAFCKSLGSRMLASTTRTTQNYLEKEILEEFDNNGSPYVWVPLEQKAINGSYTWVDNQQLAQSYWVKGENTKPLLNRGCARMSAYNKKATWTATSCNDVNGFICETDLANENAEVIPPKALPKNLCEPGWTLLNDRNCYIYRSSPLNWADAKTDCEKLAGSLVRLDSDVAQQEIMDSRITDEKSEFWTALLRASNTSDRYTWNFGAFLPLSFTNWDDISSNQISDQGLCGIAFTSTNGEKSGRWDMRNCEAAKPYMCRKAAQPNPNKPEVVPDNTTIAQCGEGGWTADPASTYCYQFHLDYVSTYQGASLVCEAAGGNLLSIHNPSERQYIQNRISAVTGVSSIWLGLNSISRPGYYVWSDNTAGSYFNWNTRPFSSQCTTMAAATGKWVTTSCQNKNFYICRKPQAGFETPAVAPTVPPPPAGKEYACKAGYKAVPGTTKCYALYKRPATYANAEANCKADGGRLATIDNEAENQVILSLYYGAYISAWIGMRDTYVNSDEMYFQLSDGRTPTFTKWSQNEPSNTLSGNQRQDCTYFYANRRPEWGDEICTRSAEAYLCETQATLAPITTTAPVTGCPLDKESLPAAALDGFCYYFSWMQTVTQTEAERQCFLYRGHLVSITSLQEQTFLAYELLKRSYNFPFYIGLTSSLLGGLQWTDNSAVDFVNFAPGAVAPVGQSCSVITGGSQGLGFWTYSQCNQDLHYICKVPRQGWTTVAVSTTTRTQDLTNCVDLIPGAHVVDGGDYCYVIRGTSSYNILFGQATFSTASANCKNYRQLVGTLASVLSNDINQKIVDYARNISYLQLNLWIGLTTGNDGHGFRWTSNDAFYFNHFAGGEPKNTGNNVCVYVGNDGFWYTAGCGNFFNYVCMYPKPHATVAPPYTVNLTTNAICGAGDKWTLLNGKCYWLGDNLYKSWYDAGSYCSSLNATLTSILDDSEQENLRVLSRTYIKSDYTWIGLNELDFISHKWSDDEPFNYEHWEDGQPNNEFGAQLCVAMDSKTGYWRDEDCTRQYGFVCKKLPGGTAPPTKPPRSGYCPDGFQTLGDKCFMVNTEKLVDHQQARNECAQYGRGVFPASVQSRSEQQFLVSMMRNARVSVWIGLVNKGEQSYNDYKWISEDQYTYSNWGFGEPTGPGTSDSDNRCVRMSNVTTEAGFWYVDSCSKPLHFACSTYISSSNAQVKDKCFPSKRSGDSCYQVSSAPLNWQNARESCAQSKANLVTISNVYDQSFVQSQVSSMSPAQKIWIGLQSTSAGVFAWENGWPVTYTNWNYDQPRLNQGCVAMNSASGRWSVENCSATYNFASRDTNTYNDPAPAPLPDDEVVIPGSSCPANYMMIGSYCYYARTATARPYGEQELICRELGGHIATIPSERVNLAIATKLQQESAFNIYYDPWIGYTMINGGLETFDGSPVTYVHWQNNEVPKPTDNSPQCVYINGKSGYWMLQPCSARLGVVCRTKVTINVDNSSSTTQKAAGSTTTHAGFTRPTVQDEHITGSGLNAGDDNGLLIALVIVGSVTGVVSLLVIGVVYLARQKPHVLPPTIVRIFGPSGSNQRYNIQESGIENEIYESASTINKPQSSGVGIEGPATIEGGTI